MTRCQVHFGRRSVSCENISVPSGKKGRHDAHAIYEPVKAKNACDSTNQQVLYTCLSSKKDRGESSRGPPSDLQQPFTLSMQPCMLYIRVRTRGPVTATPKAVRIHACLRPFIGLRTPLVLPASRTWRNVRENSSVHV